MNLDSVRSPIFIPILTFPLRGGRNRRWANDCIPSPLRGRVRVGVEAQMSYIE
jgi:hypothetical protein